jgi:hypothetical protein
MRALVRLAFIAAAPLLLASCLWGPGKFTSQLSLKKDGSFVLDYTGELMIQLPGDTDAKMEPWTGAKAKCWQGDEPSKERPCTADEVAAQKSAYDKRKSDEIGMAKAMGLPGLDEESNRAFAVKLARYAGWRSVRYRANGIFDVDYHFEGSARQDFIFPALPDNDLLVPFVALRRRADGSVLVTAPAFTGGSGPMSARAGAAMTKMNDGPVSHASGRFTVLTDGEILTNNSEEGPQPHALGRQLHWDVSPASTKIPETLVKL